MKILFADNFIIVCVKPAGVLSTDEAGGMPDLIRKELGESGAEIYTVHRLDRVVGGLYLAARTKEAAAEISRRISERSFLKEYTALVHGIPSPQAGKYIDYLVRNKNDNISYCVSKPSKDAKDAILSYKVISSENDISKVSITLETGRTHQIRAQFAYHGHTLVGDRKYGAEEVCDVALWSSRLSFLHPVSEVKMDFRLDPPEGWPGDVNPICKYKDKCGSCCYMGVPYTRQLEIKQNELQNLLKEYGKVPPVIGMDNPYHYRNKVQWAFGTGKKNNTVCGIYESNSHSLLNIDSCLIEDETADSIIRTVAGMLPRYKLAPYDERKCSGFLRHVMVRRSAATGEVMLILVAAESNFKAQKPFVNELLSLHPEITTIIFNVNDKFTPVVLGRNVKTLYGKGYIEDELLGLRFRLSPGAFYQVNSIQTEELYSLVLEYAGLNADDTVLDAYCGTGTIGLCVSGHVKQVIGVEINKSAYCDAIINAKINGVKNCRFINEDATKYMQSVSGTKGIFDTVIMDPPRSGSTPEFINALFSISPKKIIYVSCNPESLARDLKLLSKQYSVRKIQAVDMFPHTSHVETVVLMSQNK